MNAELGPNEDEAARAGTEFCATCDWCESHGWDHCQHCPHCWPTDDMGPLVRNADLLEQKWVAYLQEHGVHLTMDQFEVGRDAFLAGHCAGWEEAQEDVRALLAEVERLQQESRNWRDTADTLADADLEAECDRLRAALEAIRDSGGVGRGGEMRAIARQALAAAR